MKNNQNQRLGHGTVGGGRRARVFVVDDNDLTRRTLKHIVGHDARLQLVGEAANGASALEAMEILQPELVCLDVVMPRLDGLAVLRTIREKYPPTAVVIITGDCSPEALTEIHELGADGFVTKPFAAGTVIDTIYGALEQYRVKRLSGRCTPAPL